MKISKIILILIISKIAFVRRVTKILMDNIEHKICCDCKRNLPATEEFFDKTSKGKLGLKDICKECQMRRKTLGSGSIHRITSKYKTKKSQSKEFNDT